MERVGIWLVGAAGNVATWTAAGWAALRRGVIPPIGVATETPPFDRAGLLGFDAAVFGGHETRDVEVAATLAGLERERIAPAGIAGDLAADVAAYQAEIRPGVAEPGSWDAVSRIRDDLAAFRDRHRLARVTVLHLASTEAVLDETLPDEAPALFDALRGGLAVPPSVLYAAAAIDLGFAYANFTPSTGASIPALTSLALERGAVIGGSDGKTGETLVKTALAPMFAVRRLRVDSWYGRNVLGNRDGRALADAGSRAAKVLSKGAAIDRILGYAPESHVGIDYVPGYGDWKVAWDHIRFTGFGGAAMDMEFTWRGSDTALAAPLCIDLVRLLERAQRRGERGVLPYLAVFFKSPMGSEEHGVEAQYRMLLDHLETAEDEP